MEFPWQNWLKTKSLATESKFKSDQKLLHYSDFTQL